MEELLSKTALSTEVFPAEQGTVALLIGVQVFDLLPDVKFQQDWDALYGTCPWGTVFQSRAFVATWYHIYRSEYLPVLLTEHTGDQLTGLLSLARDKTGLIVGAGAKQAEYQVWLSSGDHGDHFISNALLKLWKHFPGTGIQLKYLPGKTPLGWVPKDKVWNKRCELRTYKHPVLLIDEDSISLELKKKNRREKINRLKRLGELKFERVTDSKTFSAIFDQLATQYDFRKGAMFNTVFFLADPLRKEFLLALFKQNLLHATILKLDNEIIASNVGTTGKNWVHLQGINSHAPLYARYSPGILHFLMLGKLLAAEGIKVFDLTPGGDSYKEGLATEFGLAYELNIGPSYNRWARHIKLKILHHIKANAARLGIKQPVLRKIKRDILFLKNTIQNAKHQGFFSFIGGHAGRTMLMKKNIAYRNCAGAPWPRNPDPVPINKDNLADLLDFDPQGGGITRWAFLAGAMRRFETGERCYSWSAAGRLLGCAWLSAPGAAPAAPNPELPQEAALLQGLYCHPAGRERYQDFLMAVTGEVVKDRKVDCVFTVVQARDAALCRSLEASGFQATGN
jgi:hypothetical protein